MNTSTAKAKGRLGQQEIVAKILAEVKFKLQEGDIVSRPMGSQGDDLIMSPLALKSLYFDGWEIKRRAKVSICRWIEQCVKRKAKKPIVCVREDRGEWLCIVRFDDLIKLIAAQCEIEL